MSKYRKKPVVIEATQWFKNGDHPKDHDHIGKGPFSQVALEKYYEYTLTEGKVVRYYRSPSIDGKVDCYKCGKQMHDHGWLDTLEGGNDGAQVVCPGDWIITGIQGEYYPCKPDIFEATYDPA